MLKTFILGWFYGLRNREPAKRDTLTTMLNFLSKKIEKPLTEAVVFFEGKRYVKD